MRRRFRPGCRLTYGVADCAEFPFLAELRELVNEETRAKLADGAQP